MAKNNLAGLPMQTPPTVTIDGQTLTVKFTPYAEYLLDEQGLTMPIKLTNENGKLRFSLFIKLFAAMVAHNFKERGEVVPTADDWAAKISIEDVKQLSAAIAAALPKTKAPAEMPLRESEPEPVTELKQ